MAAALDAGPRSSTTCSARGMVPALPAARLVILMHMRGTPATMNACAHTRDVAAEVAAELAASWHQRAAVAAGIGPQPDRARPRHRLRQDGHPQRGLSCEMPRDRSSRSGTARSSWGVSRKRFIGTLSGEADPRQRVAGSLAAAAVRPVARRQSVLRVHDVAATVRRCGSGRRSPARLPNGRSDRDGTGANIRWHNGRRLFGTDGIRGTANVRSDDGRDGAAPGAGGRHHVRPRQTIATGW